MLIEVVYKRIRSLKFLGLSFGTNILLFVLVFIFYRQAKSRVPYAGCWKNQSQIGSYLEDFFTFYWV